MEEKEEEKSGGREIGRTREEGEEEGVRSVTQFFSAVRTWSWKIQGREEASPAPTVDAAGKRGEICRGGKGREKGRKWRENRRKGG